MTLSISLPVGEFYLLFMSSCEDIDYLSDTKIYSTKESPLGLEIYQLQKNLHTYYCSFNFNYIKLDRPRIILLITLF